MRRILQAMILAAVWGSASTLAMTNEIAQSAAEKPNDVQLQAAIEEAMRTSPLTANSLIVVHVNQGEVTLEGTAKNSLAQREATRLAETVLGVKGIRNGWASSILKLPWSHRKSNCHTIPLPVLGHVPPRARESTSTATRFCAIEWTRGATKPRRKETP